MTVSRISAGMPPSLPHGAAGQQLLFGGKPVNWSVTFRWTGFGGVEPCQSDLSMRRGHTACTFRLQLIVLISSLPPNQQPASETVVLRLLVQR